VTVTAPPRPPATGDPVDWGEPEALIAEARQRMRRRRRRYAAAATVLTLVAASVIVVFGRPEPSQSLSPEPPPTLAVPTDPDDAATIVAKSAKVHRGWVVVYGDGRVIKNEDRLVIRSDDGPDLFERRLTAKGLDLVRSGAIQPRVLLPYVWRLDRNFPRKLWDNPLPADTWADAEFKPYVPSRYAACLGTPGHADPPGNATEMVGRLPDGARALLRGKELRKYSEDLFSQSDLFPPDVFPDEVPWPPVSPDECFEVSTEEAIVLFKTLRQAGFAFGWVIGDHDEAIRPLLLDPPPWSGTVSSPCGAVKQPAAVEVCFEPLLPHGQWFRMGG
jgi:hypothetical protein